MMGSWLWLLRFISRFIGCQGISLVLESKDVYVCASECVYLQVCLSMFSMNRFVFGVCSSLLLKEHTKGLLHYLLVHW